MFLSEHEIQNIQLLLPHLLNGLFSTTTWVSSYLEGKTSLDLNEARDDAVWGWQWHQLDHMQTICTLIQIDNHTNTWSLNFCRPDALPDAQPTVWKHWRHIQQAIKPKFVWITQPSWQKQLQYVHYKAQKCQAMTAMLKSEKIYHPLASTWHSQSKSHIITAQLHFTNFTYK